MFHINQANALIGTHPHLIFWISLITESQKITDICTKKTVFDFGCADGKFLQVFDLMDNLEFGIGVDIDVDLIQSAKSIPNPKLYFANKINFEDRFDLAFSQEVLYTLPDLKKHAEDMFNILKPDSYYFATMGCHIDNPLWSMRRDIIKERENFPVFNYSLDEVAKEFSSVGFKVGLKRLPNIYFAMYDEIETKLFSKDYLSLVNNISDHKMVFMFYKPC